MGQLLSLVCDGTFGSWPRQRTSYESNVCNQHGLSVPDFAVLSQITLRRFSGISAKALERTLCVSSFPHTLHATSTLEFGPDNSPTKMTAWTTMTVDLQHTDCGERASPQDPLLIL